MKRKITLPHSPQGHGNIKWRGRDFCFHFAFLERKVEVLREREKETEKGKVLLLLLLLLLLMCILLLFSFFNLLFFLLSSPYDDVDEGGKCYTLISWVLVWKTCFDFFSSSFLWWWFLIFKHISLTFLTLILRIEWWKWWGREGNFEKHKRLCLLLVFVLISMRFWFRKFFLWNPMSMVKIKRTTWWWSPWGEKAEVLMTYEALIVD